MLFNALYKMSFQTGCMICILDIQVLATHLSVHGPSLFPSPHMWSVFIEIII